VIVVMGEMIAVICLRACSWQAGQFRTGAPFTRPFPPVQYTIIHTLHSMRQLSERFVENQLFKRQ